MKPEYTRGQVLKTREWKTRECVFERAAFSIPVFIVAPCTLFLNSARFLAQKSKWSKCPSAKKIHTYHLKNERSATDREPDHRKQDREQNHVFGLETTTLIIHELVSLWTFPGRT